MKNTNQEEAESTRRRRTVKNTEPSEGKNKSEEEQESIEETRRK